MIKKMCVAGMFVLCCSCAFGVDKDDSKLLVKALIKCQLEGSCNGERIMKKHEKLLIKNFIQKSYIRGINIKC